MTASRPIASRTAALVWRFYADGPVRFAPVVHGDRVLFVSDDGYLYCVTADGGALVWKLRGGPQNRKVLGNDRLISMWPARGAPVVYGDTVYWAAGIWPFMGVFVQAVDIGSGQPVWTNSGSGSNYTVQQHDSPAFAGIAPQGYLTVNEKTLLVSGGMTVPAAFDRQTGRFLYYRPGDRELGKDEGGFDVLLGPDWFANHGRLHRLADGEPLGHSAGRHRHAAVRLRCLRQAVGGVAAANRPLRRNDRRQEGEGKAHRQIQVAGVVAYAAAGGYHSHPPARRVIGSLPPTADLAWSS